MKTIKLRNNIFLIIIAVLFLKACDNDVTQHTQQEVINMEDVNAPYEFNYHTANDVQVTISVYVNGADPVRGINFHVLTDLPENNGSLLGVGITDSEGIFEQRFQVPTYIDSLVIIGYMSTQTLPIVDGEVTYEFGNNVNFERNDSFSHPAPTMLREGIVFNYLTGYNSNGLPDSLDYEYVDPDFITRINVSLPEWSSVPATHPEYLAEGNQTNIHLLDEAAVSVTFVHEGAGYKNALGFYTYDHDTGPPTLKEDLDLWIFFPNTSIPPFQSGDKITLGTFPAGTVIGWFLVANGWSPSSQIVTEGIRIVFSDPQYNTDAVGYKQHNVFLYDEIEEKYVIAFEDLQRPWGDEDFNDAVFYASATPPEAVSQGNVALIDPTPDSDNDGVADNFDEYPNDPLRAFTVHYPSEGNFGTLSYEDLWPNKGDYDFNDLIIDYNFIHVTNANNKLVDTNAELVLKAIGAGYHNGFSIELPFPESRIQEYSGDILSVQTNLNNNNAIINIFLSSLSSSTTNIFFFILCSLEFSFTEKKIR